MNDLGGAMNALTLYEPYATAIAVGLKDTETRGALLSGIRRLIGWRIAVHAGKVVDPYAPLLPKGVLMNPGCVVATAKLAWVGEVLGGAGEGRVSVSIVGGDVLTAPSDEWGNYAVGRWLYKLTDVRPMTPPVPARGQQGVWWWEAGRNRCVDCRRPLPQDPDGLPNRCRSCVEMHLWQAGLNAKRQRGE